MGGATAGGGGFEIVQVVRRMHPHGGVGGVAHALDAAFRAQGVATRAITRDQLVKGWGEGAPRGRLGRAVEVVAFTVLASLAIRRARAADAVVLVHGDALGGDIYVDHGLHKALLARRPWLLAHPLHAFILAREEVRHALRAYRRVVCLSGAGVGAAPGLSAGPRRAGVSAPQRGGPGALPA